MTWCAENVDAIFVAYYPGTQGLCHSRCLFGIYNPTGKLLAFPFHGTGTPAEIDELPDIEDPQATLLAVISRKRRADGCLAPSAPVRIKAQL